VRADGSSSIERPSFENCFQGLAESYEMKLVVGVDGGGTKTLAAACTLEGQVVGVGRGGGSNWEGMGADRAAGTITRATEAALADAGAHLDDLLQGHMTLGGIDWPEDVPRMETALRKVGWDCPLTIENDSFGTLRACAPEGHGIGTAPGSGVCCCIIRPDGEKYFYGAFTDLGGGMNISGQVFYAVLREEDGRGQATALTPELLKATGCDSVVDLVYAAHRKGEFVSKRVTDPILFRCAREGDPIAVDIVRGFGQELALAARTLIRRYGLEESDTVVAAAGSLFVKTGPLLFDAFREDVLKTAPRARVILADQPPALGAVRGALESAGNGTPEVWERLRESATEAGWFREDMGLTAKGEGEDE
jgi:N-acetylglucosamine kinase-like BadF-type ATPase